MKKRCFVKVFENANLSIMHLDHLGVFDLGLFHTEKAYKQPIIKFFCLSRDILSTVFSFY